MSEGRCLVLLICVQLLMFVVVGARGDFPVNDDWAYAHSILWLFEEQRIRLSDWIAMNLLPQTLAGGLVAAVFGFSFENLRHLTQAVALLTSVAAFYWFRAARLVPLHATVASLSVIAMPCWPVLANSYMTDLYGLLFALAAGALFLHALERPRTRTLLAATAAAMIGVLERQVVFVLPFAFMVTWLWTRRTWSKRTVATGLGPLAATFAANACYHAYLTLGPGVPAAQVYAHGRVFPLLLKVFRDESGMLAFVVDNLASMVGYLGLFLVGWAVWWGMRSASRQARITFCAGIALAGIGLAVGWLPPYQQNNVIDAAGIGPFTVYGEMVQPSAALDRTPGMVWRIGAVAAGVGIAALLTLILTTVAHLLRTGRDAPPDRLFMVLVIAGYLSPFVVTGYFDRYLLFVLPFAFSLWARTWPAPEAVGLPQGIALAWMLSVLALSSVATRDYFAWNQARWEAIGTAERLGATPDTLDGGFEYNGFRRFEVLPRREIPGKSFWWVKDDYYIVTFSPLPGYDELEVRPVKRWLSRSPSVVRLLRRKE
jgi:hypothetical protein